MSYKFYANNRSVCTKGTPDAALSKVDMCFDLKMTLPKALPLGNVALTKNLGVGKTTKTYADGHPIWTANGELDAKTLHPVPSYGIGEVSGTYLDKCVPHTFSPDVIVEGGGVVRMDDITWQNNRNCQGKVVPAALATALAAAINADAQTALALERAAQEEARRKAEEARKAAEEAARKEEERIQELEEQKDTLCAVKTATISDENSRTAKPGGTLAVVGSVGGETITCEGELVGECLEEPEWVVNGYHSHQASGMSTSFSASSWTSGQLWLGDVRSRTSKVVFRSAVDEKGFTLKQYPADKYAITLKPPPTLDAILDGLETVLSQIAPPPSIDKPSGSVTVEAGWEEDADPAICFYGWKIAGGFNPLIGCTATIPLYGVSLPKILRKATGPGAAGFFLKISGALTFEVSVARTGVNSYRGGGELAGSISLTVSFDILLFSDKVLDISIGVTGSVKGTGKIESRVRGPSGKPTWSIDATAQLVGFAKITLFGGFIEIDKKVTLLKSKKFFDKSGTFPP